MTYGGKASRSSNRILVVLVVITIAIVAFWAATGGIDDTAPTEPNTVVVDE